MFLSKIAVPDKRSYVDLLHVKNHVHAAFNGTHTDRSLPESSGVLYRVDDGNILVQSRVQPNWKVPAQIKRFEPGFQVGQEFIFTLKANPTKRERGGGKRRMVRSAEQMDWMERKALAGGFVLVTASVIATKGYESEFQPFLETVTYHGVLRVEDVNLFQATFVAGIGSGKAWGCGLLSLAVVA